MLDGIAIENSKIHIDKLEKDTPPEAILLSSKLYKIIPKIKLLYLLFEVSRWTDFYMNVLAKICKNLRCNTGNIVDYI